MVSSICYIQLKNFVQFIEVFSVNCYFFFCVTNSNLVCKIVVNFNFEHIAIVFLVDRSINQKLYLQFYFEEFSEICKRGDNERFGRCKIIILQFGCVLIQQEGLGGNAWHDT
eukprot:TRINITY_DN3931_c4_g1_i2.p1 TRINITY_DN3931_c4_g1~~TRINITY_DN3931_c4_g1_i2.p1  ORF type:complete len:112 (+),score=0.14 TRINITY_DN3931_c4_g1_i2:76-411(+)